MHLEELPPNQDDFMCTAQEDLHKQQQEKVEYWSFPLLYEKYKKVFHYYFVDRLQRIKGFKPELKSLFDIGTGYGFWPQFCKDHGISVKGIDIFREAVTYAQEVLHLDVVNCSLEDYIFDRTFDVITICDLLEHLREPNSQLEKIKRGLSETGILFIQVPNLLGFKLPPFHGFGLPYHIWQFNLLTLRMLLKKHGFVIIDFWSGALGIIGVYEAGGPTLYQRIMWQLAKRSRFGNRLIVVAKKV